MHGVCALTSVQVRFRQSRYASFFVQSSDGNPYETTTMEDCCRPSCASEDWVTGMGLAADADYNSFYSCDATGTPFTE